MPLTVRTNGTSGSNVIQAAWFNDIRDLLTGVMKDQEVTIKNNLALRAIANNPGAAPGGTLAASSALGIGIYKYVYTFVSASGESTQSNTLTITTTTGNQSVNLTGIVTGAPGTVARNVYRTVVGGAVFKLLTTLNDNVTTTFADTTPDGSLGASNPPVSSSFGGSLLIESSNGTINGQIFNDGSITVNNLTLLGAFIGATLSATNLSLTGSILAAVNATLSGFLSAKYINPEDPAFPFINGSTSGTLKLYQLTRGTVKITLLIGNNFRNGGGSVQTLGFPVGYTDRALFFCSDTPGFTLRVGSGGSDITNHAIITSIASGGGTSTLTTAVNNWSIGELRGPFDTLGASSGNASAHNYLIFMIGD